MFEFEKKALLKYEEYKVLRKIVPKDVKEVTQTNYYYDTDELALNSLGITCRVREKNGKYVATLKAHQADDSECSIEQSKKARGPHDNRLFKKMGAVMQGHLVTKRILLYKNDGIEAVLDKNDYLGKIDYELEIEYRPDKEAQAEELLCFYGEILGKMISDHNGMIRSNGKSKSARFFERKNKLLQKRGEKNDICFEHNIKAS